MIIGGAALQPSGFGRRHEIADGPGLDCSWAGLDGVDGDDGDVGDGGDDGDDEKIMVMVLCQEIPGIIARELNLAERDLETARLAGRELR